MGSPQQLWRTTLSARVSRPARRFVAGLLSVATAAVFAVLAGDAPAAAAPGQPAAAPFRPSLPEPTGPHPTGMVELHLVDHDRADPWMDGRPRELMVSVWYPAEPGDQPLAPYMRPGAAEHFAQTTLAGLGLEPDQIDATGITTHARAGAPVAGDLGNRPVVLYSPGLTNPRTLGTVQVEELASQGYVVVTIDHTHETSEVEFPGGRVEVSALPPEQTPEVLKKVLAIRVADTRFVLDQLELLHAGKNPDAAGRQLPDGLGEALDLSRAGMFGHSGGGFTAAETMLVDERVDAGIDMDGSLLYSVSANDLGEVAERGLDRPFMLVGAGTTGEEELPHTHHNTPDWKSFWEHSTGWKLDLYLAEGEHFTFTDSQVLLPQLAEEFGLPEEGLATSVGTVDPARAVAALRAYVPAFFDEHLRDRPQDLLDGPSPDHPEIEFVPWAAGDHAG